MGSTTTNQPHSESEKDLHLYFGFNRRIPIGVDSSFPRNQIANANDHIQWAEKLLDAGVYYQAQQQLDLLKEPETSCARANWLRARLELVKFKNACERHKRHLDIMLSEPHEWSVTKNIRNLLDEAIKKSPEFGPAYVTAAQVYLDPLIDQDYVHALELAQRAQELIGEIPQVLLVLGQALRGVGNAKKAVEVLSQISSNSKEGRLAQSDLKLAKLEMRCLFEPIDVEAHLQMGRWYLRVNDTRKACEIFKKLVNRCPDYAGGYYGLAHLVFLKSNKSDTERLTESYSLCQEALKRDQSFGLVYELLGNIFYSLEHWTIEVGFPRENSQYFYQQALKLDNTCEMALLQVAKHHIKNRELKSAIELLEKAVELDTDNAEVFFILAVIYRGTRQFEKEHWAHNKAKELSPHTELDPEYTNEIRKLCSFEY